MTKLHNMKHTVVMDAELILVVEAPCKFRWQSKLTPIEIVARLHAAAERMEEQIADGIYDDLLERSAR